MCHLWPHEPLRNEPKTLVPVVPGTGAGFGGTLLLGHQETQGREGLQAGSTGYPVDTQESGAATPPCWLGCGESMVPAPPAFQERAFLGNPKLLNHCSSKLVFSLALPGPIGTTSYLSQTGDLDTLASFAAYFCILFIWGAFGE